MYDSHSPELLIKNGNYVIRKDYFAENYAIFLGAVLCMLYWGSEEDNRFDAVQATIRT